MKSTRRSPAAPEEEEAPSSISTPSKARVFCTVVGMGWLDGRLQNNDRTNSNTALSDVDNGHGDVQSGKDESTSSGSAATCHHSTTQQQRRRDREQIADARDDNEDCGWEIRKGRAMMRPYKSQRVVVGRGHNRQQHHIITRLYSLVWMACLVLPLCGLITHVDGFRTPFLPVAVSRPNDSSCATSTARYGTTKSGGDNDDSSSNKHHQDDDLGNKHHKRRPSSSSRRRANGRSSPASAAHNVTATTTTTSSFSSREALQRITQLEDMVAKQAVEMKRLRDECKRLTEAVDTFASVVELLREAGLNQENENDNSNKASSNEAAASSSPNEGTKAKKPMVESLEDDDEIFGKAPSSIMDAADAAGAAVLAGLLAGQRRLLVDVRDAELSKPEQLVQFLELTILPVAAGLEGLKSKRNRLKLVFPKVSQLLEYRKTMALAAPEVVALSTMDFDPIESHDNLVVVLAPHPDDTEGVQAMKELLDPKGGITQPVVVFNPHMAPVSDPAADFEVAYQLRLFTVHYVAKPPPPTAVDDDDDDSEETNCLETKDQLAAAMEHAKEVSRNPIEHGGTTRSMLIRAYPNPWNVFVDISPDTDADFVVAATFAQEPTPHELNTAVIECLQGSEEEDELVAQQMQQALEAGQLDRVSELLGAMGLDFSEDEDNDSDDDDDSDEDLWQLPDVDTV